MKSLPNVNALIAEITTQVEKTAQEKTAAEAPAKEFSTPEALEIVKVAQQLRDASAAVTYSDVRSFVRRATEAVNG